MNNDITSAKNILINNDYTCVLYLNGKEFHSKFRGVKPLLQFLESADNFEGFFAADKVVGAGAAYLYVLLGVKSVWAGVISAFAKKILEQNGIDVLYENLVENIINRAGNGICPIEAAVKDITEPRKALLKIKETLKSLEK